MAEKHLVVQGATCLCNFGSAPDKLKVLTHKREFANDGDSGTKFIASNKDIGTTFEKNTFGSCAKQLNKPCQAVITEWTGFYEKITLTNGGLVLLEDSKATCPIGGKDCILIIKHGQTAELNAKTVSRAKPEVSKVLNPAVDIEEMTEPQFNDNGNSDAVLINSYS